MYRKIITGIMIALWICAASPAIATCVSQCKGNEREADGFCYTVSRGEVTIMAYTGDDQDIFIPDTIGGMPVTQIGINAFRDCIDIISIVIADTVVNIGINAFRDCPNLESVIFPASLRQVGNNAFRDCTNLSSIYFYGDAPSVGANAFFGSSDYCIVYYAPEAQGFGDNWRGYPAEPAYPPEEEQGPIFICEPLWVGPWVGLSTNPASPHRPKKGNMLFWAIDSDTPQCKGIETHWMYRPVDIQGGQVIPLDDWTVRKPWRFLWWVWIEDPWIAEIPESSGLYEFKATVQDCAGNTTDSEKFWGKRYFFQID